MAYSTPEAATASTPDCGAEPVDRAAVLRFVDTPFGVRRNVVKAWRTLPAGLWIALSERYDRQLAVGRERRAVAGVVLVAAVLLIGFSGAGLEAMIEGQAVCVPLVGRTNTPIGEMAPSLGWCYVPGKSLTLVLWTVGPSLVGWVCMRWIWIPAVARGGDNREAVLNCARHLGSVYFYVYLMILVGASLMPLLILASPGGTVFLRWCLWCFLFGESFFVPAVMWIRLILHDRTGAVFGRWRKLGLGLYLLLFVVVPILGMVTELDG